MCLKTHKVFKIRSKIDFDWIISQTTTKLRAFNAGWVKTWTQENKSAIANIFGRVLSHWALIDCFEFLSFGNKDRNCFLVVLGGGGGYTFFYESLISLELMAGVVARAWIFNGHPKIRTHKGNSFPTFWIVLLLSFRVYLSKRRIVWYFPLHCVFIDLFSHILFLSDCLHMKM